MRKPLSQWHPCTTPAPKILFTLSLILALQTCSRERVSFPEPAVPDLLSGLPLQFIKNVGQTLPEVAFHAEAAGHTLQFLAGKVIFRRSGPQCHPWDPAG